MFIGISPEMIWLLLGLAFLVSELILPTFVLMFFGLGACVTAACAFLGFAPHLILQVLIFAIVALLSLYLFRTRGKALSRGQVSGINKESDLGSVVGCLAMVIEDIDPQKHSGKVELHGTNWQATSEELIKKGVTVEVISSSNLRLKVKAIN